MRVVLVLVAFFIVAGAAGAAATGVRLATSRVVVVPDTPRAGHGFSASMRVTRRDNGGVVRSGKVTCSAGVGAKALVRVRAGFRSGRVSCTWRLPAAASGKHVLGWLRLDAHGGLARRFFGRPIL
jgi:hypothetical protein